VTRGRIQSEHFVQFFDTPDSRSRNVASYVSKTRDQRVLLVVRPVNWRLISVDLSRNGFDVDEALRSGRMAVKDADALLAIMGERKPNREIFMKEVASVVRQMALEGGVTIYGELVDLYATNAEFDGAMVIEGFWNELAQEIPMTLMCGYSAAHFVSAGTRGRLSEVCQAHAHTRAHDADLLAAWLLDTARLPFHDQPFSPQS